MYMLKSEMWVGPCWWAAAVAARARFTSSPTIRWEKSSISYDTKLSDSISFRKSISALFVRSVHRSPKREAKRWRRTNKCTNETTEKEQDEKGRNEKFSRVRAKDPAIKSTFSPLFFSFSLCLLVSLHSRRSLGPLIYAICMICELLLRRSRRFYNTHRSRARAREIISYSIIGNW